MSDDASPVASSDEIHMRDDMENAPLGKRILLINPGGCLVQGTLTSDSRQHFIEWQYLPKRARKNHGNNT